MKINKRQLAGISTLSRLRIAELQANVEELREGQNYWRIRCRKDTAEGQEAYSELSRIRNALRSRRAQLRKWSKTHRALLDQITVMHLADRLASINKQLASTEKAIGDSRVGGFRVWLAVQHRWIENVPATEALTYKEEGYTVLRMDVPFQTPPK